MYHPKSYLAALSLMILSMVCWGSWANTMKVAKAWPFSAFYWDYVTGLAFASVVWGVLFGGEGFSRAMLASDHGHALLAICGGVIFNVANLLLVAAIDLAGMAVAFPIGIGLALVIGVLLNFLVAPSANPALIMLGVLLVTVAILLDAAAYRRREKAASTTGSRAIWISIGSGLLMGLFYPFVARAMQGVHGLSPYVASVWFSLGVVLCALPVNYALMKRPITKTKPVVWADYVEAPRLWHMAALAGGALWCTGALANFVASGSQLVGPAASYALGQGATMISALWGVFIWREFRTAPAASRRLLPAMFLFFLAGLVCIALAPVL